MIDYKILTEDSDGVVVATQEEERIGIMTFRQDDEIMIIDHTEVTPEYEGQGIATKLVLTGVEYARENNFKILPLCPFAKDFLNKTDEYKDILV